MARGVSCHIDGKGCPMSNSRIACAIPSITSIPSLHLAIFIKQKYMFFEVRVRCVSDECDTLILIHFDHCRVERGRSADVEESVFVAVAFEKGVGGDSGGKSERSLHRVRGEVDEVTKENAPILSVGLEGSNAPLLSLVHDRCLL